MSEAAPKVTAEMFSIPVGDAFLVYAPLRQAAFLANSATVDFLADVQSGRVPSSVSANADLIELLRRLELLDGGVEKAPITSFAGDPRPTSMTLFLTTACNLRCTYCYASAGDTPRRVMPFSVAKRGIDFVLANALALGAPSIDIAYHGGGEPTVNWETLRGSFEYATQEAAAKGLTVHAALATNGVVPDYKIDWIIQHLDGVSLSFDGLPEVHDANRLTVAGRGSSVDVTRTIRRFDNANFDYGLRLTVTKDHIASMQQSVLYILENFRPRRIQVEPAYQLGRWRDQPSSETEDFIEGFRAAQTVARRFGRQIEFSGARVGTLSNHFCGITQDSFCLTADGQVSACYETFIEENEWSKSFFYGRPDQDSTGYIFTLPVLDDLRQQTVDKREFCRGCFAKWTCGGDCYHKSLTVNGNGEFAGTERCHIIRELTKDQILTKIQDSGGLFWHEERGEGSMLRSGKEALS